MVNENKKEQGREAYFDSGGGEVKRGEGEGDRGCTAAR